MFVGGAKKSVPSLHFDNPTKKTYIHSLKIKISSENRPKLTPKESQYRLPTIFLLGGFNIFNFKDYC